MMSTLNAIEKNTVRECREALGKNPQDAIAKHRLGIIARKHCYSVTEFIEKVMKKKGE